MMKPYANFSRTLAAFMLLVLSASFVLQHTAIMAACPAITPNTICVNNTNYSFQEGTSGIANITGEGFDPNNQASVTVSLLGSGNLGFAILTATQINATIPANLSVGTYSLIVVKTGEPPLQVGVVSITPVPTAAPPPTDFIPPTPIPPPTDVPGSPNLLLRSYTATPSTIKPGEQVSFTLDIINQGTRPALGVSLSLDSGGKFVPAEGQATIILPDIGVGGAVSVRLIAVAAADTTAGPQTLSVTMTYRDFTASPYSSKGTLSVNVNAVASISQVTMARYLVDPNPVVPGQPVTVTILLQNTGTKTAGQVLVQVGDGILLAGPQGNSFPVGNIEPSSSLSVDLPLIVNTNAKAGPQSQSLTINYLQDAEVKSASSSMTIMVANVVAPKPLLLLESYSIGEGKDSLEPGEEFTLTVNLKNIGEEDANNLTVTFGAVDSSNGTPSAVPGSSTFAPLGRGGTVFAGKLEKQTGAIQITQDFIVSGSVDSGIYNLPVTLRYQKADGTADQDNLAASIVVLVRPNLSINFPTPLLDSINQDEALNFELEVNNRGRKQLNVTNAQVSVENGEVLDGAETFIGPLQPSESGAVTGTIMPLDVGTLTITLTINYTDDLNRPAKIEKIYTVEVFEAIPIDPIDPGFPIDPGNGGFIPTPEAPADPNELLTRFLFGLLGLGS